MLVALSNLSISTVFSWLSPEIAWGSPRLVRGGLPVVVSLMVMGDPGAVSWIASPSICTEINGLVSVLSFPHLTE